VDRNTSRQYEPSHAHSLKGQIQGLANNICKNIPLHQESWA
ncbi:9648_t:CDS:1, partial [Funneliformis geosporum]